MATLTQDTLKALSLIDVKQLRKDEVQEVEYISSDINYDEFFSRFLVPNRPCVFGPHITREWRGIQDWVKEDGRPNLDFLNQQFGNAIVPVADCKRIEYTAQPKSDMKLSQYLQNWETLSKDVDAADSSCLYLKDWHFKKFFPDYAAYKTPIFFTSDWMNEYWDVKPGQNADDYRFVYMGPKGSWTPFHADVFQSYSWSANICGCKRWLLYFPGQEAHLRDNLGNLPYDVTSPEMYDEHKYPHYHKACKPYEVIQGPGEVIFVPSGWHHQVFNIEDTISINHNWLNGCNVDLTWAFLQQELASVKTSISDCMDMKGWDIQCQLIMKVNTGIDYPEFLQLLWTVAVPRLQQLQHYKKCSGEFHDSRLEELDEAGDLTHNSSELYAPMAVVEWGNYGRTVQSTKGVDKLEASTHGDCKLRTEDTTHHLFPSHSAPEIRTQDLNTKSATPLSSDEASVYNTSNVFRKQTFPHCNSGIQRCILGSIHNPLESLTPLEYPYLDIGGQSQIWHLIFDLCRIREVLTLLLADEDFCRIERARLCIDPHQFRMEITCAMKDLV